MWSPSPKAGTWSGDGRRPPERARGGSEAYLDYPSSVPKVTGSSSGHLTSGSFRPSGCRYLLGVGASQAAGASG